MVDDFKFRFSVPEIRLPIREEDCSAAPVCEAVGNLRRGCQAGSSLLTRPDSQVCITSLILLVARLAGMWPQEMIDQVEKKRLGFDLRDTPDGT